MSRLPHPQTAESIGTMGEAAGIRHPPVNCVALVGSPTLTRTALRFSMRDAPTTSWWQQNFVASSQGRVR